MRHVLPFFTLPSKLQENYRQLFVYMSFVNFIKQIFIKLNMHNLKKLTGHKERNFIFKDLVSRF